MKISLWLALLVPLAAAAASSGTDVVGEKETELGLFLSLWPDERAASLQDLPLHQAEDPQPLDAEAFRRRVERDEAHAAERREQLHRSQ